ncbi:hypothetical protein ElyMa_003675600 [Elysia marginata]|uniref:CCHC-type domain-containing protein n=1 Tax=Elysia marginata TaxID=1093978 RepID=A0AAV4EY81_9GAST|nr:hypothetical protein ElyMa_003675600 [Elysia marginata]
MEGIRDPQGKLTEWLSGRRFVWIDVPKTNIEQYIDVSQFKARLFHKEMVTEMTCRRCLKKGHSAKNCTYEEVCFVCKKPGHRAVNCQKQVEEDKSEKEMRDQITDTEEERHQNKKALQGNSEGEESEIGPDISGGWTTVKTPKKSKKTNQNKGIEKTSSPTVRKDSAESQTPRESDTTDRRGRTKSKKGLQADITKYLEKARSLSNKRYKPDSPTLKNEQRPRKHGERSSDMD